ncbi:sensor histidine kinase [Actinomadura chibensis]|uniref:histidine kinase n=1 Tax=Actinomadura chibensis TaxID=392828 RepID=A0A5D0NGY2_9ACTN|nr:HAMP domain-containing sensor histidine kinase [Actinomadura chibensis]TYB43599.1 HAMP domain-containing histidine kinase [Actinomadura chibensis]
MTGRGRPWSVGLRVRLAAAFTAVALFAALLASGISYVLLRRLMLQRAQDAVLTDVRDTLARQIPPQLPPDTDGLVRAQLADALAGPGRSVAAVPVPLDGRLVLPDPPQLDVPVSPEFARRAVDGMVFQRMIWHGRPYLLVGARVTGYLTTVDEPWRTTPPMVFVSASLSREAADLRLFTRALLVADAAALVAALALALLATGGVLRPVRRLGAAARALGAGDLKTRVAVRGGDELADLARTFNATAEALERTVTELRAMEAASRRFVADVSHELRTPLTSMVAMTDLLAEEAAAAGGGTGGGTAARLVAGETRRLGQLVEHLIEISRFDAGAAALVLDDVDVAAAVAATLRARGWHDEVAVEGPSGLFARLDPRRFDVIVANLAGNALKHGRPPVALRFGRAERDGAAGVEVVVSDRGPGLPDDLLPVVFDRFVKSEAARSRSEGSGLGLSIARENAVLHGGALDAANAPGGGAVFTLWLPEGQDPS